MCTACVLFITAVRATHLHTFAQLLPWVCLPHWLVRSKSSNERIRTRIEHSRLSVLSETRRGKKIGNGSCRRFNGNVRSWFYYGRSELYRSLRLPGKFVPKGSPVASALPINAKRVGGRGTPSRRCSLRTLPSYLRLRFAVGSPEKTEIKKGPFVFKRQYQTGREHTHFNFCQPAPSRSAHWTSDGETAPSSDG